jgi:hypothetical protein
MFGIKVYVGTLDYYTFTVSQNETYYFFSTYSGSSLDMYKGLASDGTLLTKMGYTTDSTDQTITQAKYFNNAVYITLINGASTGSV